MHYLCCIIAELQQHRSITASSFAMCIDMLAFCIGASTIVTFMSKFQCSSLGCYLFNCFATTVSDVRPCHVPHVLCIFWLKAETWLWLKNSNGLWKQ